MLQILTKHSEITPPMHLGNYSKAVRLTAIDKGVGKSIQFATELISPGHIPVLPEKTSPCIKLGKYSR